MSNMQPMPPVPGAGDSDPVVDDTVVGDDEQPLDPDVDDSSVNSADADEQAAMEGELPSDA